MVDDDLCLDDDFTDWTGIDWVGFVFMACRGHNGMIPVTSKEPLAIR